MSRKKNTAKFEETLPNVPPQPPWNGDLQASKSRFQKLKTRGEHEAVRDATEKNSEPNRPVDGTIALKMKFASYEVFSSGSFKRIYDISSDVRARLYTKL